MNESRERENPAFLVIDMVKDTFDQKNNFPITQLARLLIQPILTVSDAFRRRGWPVVFATDAFRKDDFIFTGTMKPHSIEGTPGAEVISELRKEEHDLWLPKRRLSAFFGTKLDRWLKDRDVTLCAVAGVTTNFCVLATAIDAVCYDFKAVILEDCTIASSKKIHRQTVDIYRKTALFPLLRVMSSERLLKELIPD